MLRRPLESAQYTSAQHARLAKRHGVRLSVGRRGQCWDNAVAESFFATLKTELIHRQAWPTRKAAHQATFEYIEGWYSTRRRHSSLGYLVSAAEGKFVQVVSRLWRLMCASGVAGSWPQPQQ